MTVVELAAVYFVVGAGAASSFLAMSWRGASEKGTLLLDSTILLPFWPLYGPFVLLRDVAIPRQESSEAPSKASMPAMDAVLSELLPDAAMARALDERLGEAQSRIVEIDRLLGLQDFSKAAANRRYEELKDRGDSRAAATARRRLAAIGRLEDLRQRFANELTEIDETLAQLRVQAEVVRLSGSAGGSRDHTELIDELVIRMESLEAMLEPIDGGPGEGGAYSTVSR